VIFLRFADGLNESIGLIISGVIAPPIILALANSLKPFGLQYYFIFLGMCGLIDLIGSITTIANYPISNITYTIGWILGIILFADSGLLSIISIIYLIAVPFIAYWLSSKF